MSTVRIILLVLLASPAELEAQSGGPGAVERGFGSYAEVHPSIADVNGNNPNLKVSTGTSPVSPSVGVMSLSVTATRHAAWFDAERIPQSIAPERKAESDGDGQTSSAIRDPPLPNFNQNIFYKNRLEFSLDGGWLPVNIPFVFDVFLGDGYTTTSLKYTLVPVIASLRWQMDDVGGPGIFRGNWDLTASGAVTIIPRGPETRYFAWIMGIRRNFVPRHGRFAPYFDGRLGLGDINAKEPLGVLYAQGQDFTFTVNMGSGVRYNFNPRYSISAGLNWMHISNLYLSEPKFANYGINVYGPMFGIDVRLGKPRHPRSE